MSRPTPLSGFPELLPAQRVVEQRVLDSLRRTFELHGFAGVETRAVEPMSVLLRKGEIDKEVYAVRRLQEERADGAQRGEDADGLALHFDLTVPFARYVTENAGHLPAASRAPTPTRPSGPPTQDQASPSDRLANDWG